MSIVPSYDCFDCDENPRADLVYYDNGWRSFFDEVEDSIAGEFQLDINKSSQASLVLPLACCSDVSASKLDAGQFELRFFLQDKLWWRGNVTDMVIDQKEGTVVFTAENGFTWIDAISVSADINFSGDLAEYGAYVIGLALDANPQLGYSIVTYPCGVPVVRDIDAAPNRSYLDVLDDETELTVVLIGSVFHVGCPGWETVCLDEDDFLDFDQQQFVFSKRPSRVYVDGDGSLVGFAEDATRVPRVDAHFDMNHVSDQAELDAFALRKLNEVASVFNPPKEFRLNPASGVCPTVFLPGTLACFKVDFCDDVRLWKSKVSRVKVAWGSDGFSLDISTV
jgi:hypothetical protein